MISQNKLAQRILGPILTYRYERTFEFKMEDRQCEVIVHPRYIQHLDELLNRKCYNGCVNLGSHI